MSIITATARFTPSGDTRRLVDLYVQVRVFTAARKAQTVVVDAAKSLCAVATGELSESIHAGEIIDDGQRIIAPVIADADHAGFVEFGTGLHGAGTYPYPLPTEGVPITGSWIYDYKHQNWAGQVAQPFMRPALDQSREQVLQEFKSE